MGRPPSRGRTGLIVGIAIAVVVLLAGAGTGAFLLLRGEGESTTTTTARASEPASTTLANAPTESTTVGPDATLGGGGPSGTAQTVPELGGGNTGGQSQDQALEHYLRVADDLATLLLVLDGRIPELAQRINETAPKVPEPVWNELQEMMGRLDGAFTSLAQVRIPPGFEDSDAALSEAAMAMGNRIDATIMGIEALWDTGKVSSAATYFDMGRQARDEYREYVRIYQELTPDY